MKVGLQSRSRLKRRVWRAGWPILSERSSLTEGTLVTRITTAVLVVALTAPIVQIAGAGAAAANTPGCVSRFELNRVGDTDYSMRRIHRIFDTVGRLEDKSEDLRGRVYKGCRKHSQVGVTYFRREGAWRWWGHWSYGF